jgi:purine catabolism regulator
MIAGKSIDHIINSISVLEVPEATEFIMPNELLISSFYSILNNIDQQVDLIKKLKSRNVSGLILCHKGIILKNISEELVQICNEIDFPLIVAAPNVSYFNIINPIMDILLEKKSFFLKNSLDIQNLFIESMITSKNIDSILNVLKKVIEKTILFLDYNLNLQYKSDPFDKNSILEKLKITINSNLDRVFQEGQLYIELENTWYVKPVTSSKNIHGFLIIKFTEPLSELDTIAISQAINSLATISTLEINKKEYLQSVRKNYLVELFFSNSNIDSNQIARGRSLGYNIENLKQAIIIDIFNFNSVVINSSESSISLFKKDLFQKVISSISFSEKDYIAFEYSDKIILLFSDYSITLLLSQII